MPYFKSHAATAGPGNVFAAHPDVYRHWAEMGQALINGPSPLTPAERELIQAFVAGLIDCRYAHVAHTACAVARGIEPGVVETLLTDIETAPISARLKPVMAYVRKLAVAPTTIGQADADAVFAAGWDEKALHDAIAVTARMIFMSRIIFGHGFTPMTPEQAKTSAEHRAKVGYVALYPALGGKQG
jgi:uncharacterized peroxidase-related enzyme